MFACIVCGGVLELLAIMFMLSGLAYWLISMFPGLTKVPCLRHLANRWVNRKCSCECCEHSNQENNAKQ